MEWHYSSIRTLAWRKCLPSPISRPLLGSFLVRANGKRVCTTTTRVFGAQKRRAWGEIVLFDFWNKLGSLVFGEEENKIKKLVIFNGKYSNARIFNVPIVPTSETSSTPRRLLITVRTEEQYEKLSTPILNLIYLFFCFRSCAWNEPNYLYFHGTECGESRKQPKDSGASCTRFLIPFDLG